MKKFVITEEEKKRILNLYEVTNSSTSLEDTAETQTKKFGLTVIWKYRHELKNIVNLLISVIPVNNTTDYSEFKTQYCGEKNQSKLTTHLKTNLTPIFTVIDSFFVRLQTDLKVGTVNEAINVLYKTFSNPIFKLIIKFIGKLVPQETTIAKEIILGVQNYLSSKYGKEGDLFNSVLSGILGELGVEYAGVCNFM
jgi:hypothetical protein